MKKVSIIGLFCNGREVSDGQSIKTRIVAQAVEKSVGSQHVHKIDTYGWKKHPFKLFFNCIRAVFCSKNVIFLTDAGGIKIFPWLLNIVNIFVNRTIHYVVVGGWLIHYAPKHKVLSFFLKKLDGIFIETQVMQTTLEGLGFQNVYLMPNFKDLTLVSENELYCSNTEPFRFCIFSRVMKEKGIAYAVDAVRNTNNYYGRTVCTLDIYGQIDSNQTEWFDELKQTFSNDIRYEGVVPFNESVHVLKDYYALLFPTQFYTEGVPGTIIDAYAAAIPVVASEWESVFDIIEPGVTGITYNFEMPEALQECLMNLIKTPEKVFEMKKNCLNKAEQYLPDFVIDILVSKLD